MPAGILYVYLFIDSKRHTVSTCTVLGNRSTGVASTVLYPSESNTAQSLASVAWSHETYTTLSGFIFTTVSISSFEQPFLGGSRMTTSGFRFSLSRASAAADASAQIKRAFFMPFISAFVFAFSTASGIIYAPITSLTLSAMDSPIVPAPQYKSSRTASGVRCAYSAAFLYKISAIVRLT